MAKNSAKSGRPASSQQPTKPADNTGGVAPLVWVVVGVLGVAAVFGAYQFFVARNATSPAPVVSAPTAGAASDSAPITGPEVDGAAQVAGGVQKITVNVTTVYNPNVILLKAGVPAELTFAGGQGCTVRVHSQELGFQADISSGPKTVKVQALQPGTYAFTCGMDMVHGRIVVK